jgi:tryptophan synthase alpha chain
VGRVRRGGPRHDCRWSRPRPRPSARRACSARAAGFVYCVSRTGVTGDGRAFAAELDGLVASVRKGCDLPVGIGFGVTDAEKARFVAARARR